MIINESNASSKGLSSTVKEAYKNFDLDHYIKLLSKSDMENPAKVKNTIPHNEKGKPRIEYGSCSG